jgi:hypothetical protein
VDAGTADGFRRRLDLALRTATFAATVEHTTGRKVIGFLSDTHLDPPFSVEIFRLARD